VKCTSCICVKYPQRRRVNAKAKSNHKGRTIREDRIAHGDIYLNSRRAMCDTLQGVEVISFIHLTGGHNRYVYVEMRPESGDI
jgi:hypothetical protein